MLYLCAVRLDGSVQNIMMLTVHVPHTLIYVVVHNKKSEVNHLTIYLRICSLVGLVLRYVCSYEIKQTLVISKCGMWQYNNAITWCKNYPFKGTTSLL